MNEETNTETTESTQTTEISAPAQSTEAPVQQDLGGGDQPVAAEAPAWTPTLKYKFNGMEKDFDPIFKDIVKDQDTEKKIRDLLERNEAFDMHKQKSMELEQKFKKIEPEYQKIVSNLQHATKLWETDKGSFFEYMGIPKEDLFKYVAEELQREELPQQHRSVYDNERNLKLKAMEQERQLQEYQARAFDESVKAKSFQLEQELGKADVQRYSQAYDDLYGSGSFRSEIIKLGQTEAALNGKDLSVAEAVDMIVSKVKPIVERFGGNQISNQQNQPVISTIKAGASSPAKRAVRSLDDLKKLSAAL
jgi:hypothetical protein